MWSDSIPGAAGEGAGGAGDLFTARIHGLVDLQREIGDQAAEWAERREPRAEEYTARLVVESMRSLLLLKTAKLTERDEPPSIDEVAHLALALHRIEGANRHRLARDQATAETAAPPAPREYPSTEEMRALLGPAIKEAFHPERLGSKPWEPWPNAPSPAEPVAGEPEPPWDPSAGHSAPDAPPVAQVEEEAREARDGSDPEGSCEAEDGDRARERHDMGHVRGAHDDVHAPKAHDDVHARGAHDDVHARGARDDVHARKARDADDVPHIARPNRWSWNGELWPPEIPLDPSRW